MASIASWARVEIDLDSGSRLRVGRQRKTRPAKPERAQFTPRLVALPRSAGLDHRPPKGLDIGRHASRPGAGDNLPDQAEGALLVGGQDVEPVGIVTLIHSYSGGHLAVSSTAFRAASTAVASASRALPWRTSLPVSLAASLSLSAMSLSSSSRFFSRPANSRRMSSQDRAALSLCFSSEARSASFVNTWRKTGFPYNWAISSTAACILLSISSCRLSALRSASCSAAAAPAATASGCAACFGELLEGSPPAQQCGHSSVTAATIVVLAFMEWFRFGGNGLPPRFSPGRPFGAPGCRSTSSQIRQSLRRECAPRS